MIIAVVAVQLLIAALSVVSADDSPSYKFKCQKPTLASTSLPPLFLPLNYQAAVRYTNWDNSTTALITERNYTDVIVVKKVDKTGAKSYIIRKDGVLTFTDSTCANTSADAVLPTIYQFNPFIEANIVGNSTNLADIIKALNASQSHLTYQGILETGIVGGIDAVGWIGCWQNITGDNETGVQIEVYYAGDKSQPPYSPDFKNPILLSVHFSLFKGNDTNGTITSHYSLDVVELSKTDEAKKSKDLQTPKGVYCDGMLLADLPVNIPDRFGASIDFVNTQTKEIDSAQLLYDGVLKVTSFSMDFENDKDLPFIAGVEVPKDLKQATIYRDFSYGIQYVLSKDSRVCNKVEPLDARYGDAVKMNDVVSMKSAVDILLNADQVKFYNAGQKIVEGVAVDSFVAKKDETGGAHVVLEVNFVQEDWSVENIKGKQLFSIAHYHRDKDNKVTLETHIHFDNFQNYTDLGPLWIKSNVFPCSIEAVEDNFFYISLKNASLKDIRAFGTDNVECALAEAISKAANVSVLRISYFMLKQDSSEETLACFLMGEKSTVTPTKTAYLKPELSVAEFKKAINDSVTTAGIVANLITETKKQASISIDKFGVISTHEPQPPEPPKFVGYSGGSMFILAIFSFVFGSGLALGTYLFYNKRRTIGGMAYQVFE